jgi:hypothetical protein
MRPIALLFALCLAGVPAIQAQEVVAPTSAEQLDSRPATTSSDVPADVVPAPVQSEARLPRAEIVEAAPIQQVSVRSILTIIGAIVVVLALVAFLT